MNTNYNSIIKYIIFILATILFAYIINTILYMYLPKNTPQLDTKIDNSLDYKRYNIKYAFQKKKIPKKIIKQVVKKKKEYRFLSNVTLVAIYAMENKSGFVIIKERNKNDTTMLSVNDKFKGYTLSKIFSKYVIFIKNNQEYKLSMGLQKNDIKYEVVHKKTIDKNIEVKDDNVFIKRDIINNYINNFDKIWKDVSINEVRTSKGIDGFKVYNIRKGSVFAKIGLKKNDIIKSVNNIELKSYNDAFKIYKKINKIKDLNLKILRDGKEKEIMYEIK